jgi:hypothetical protein
MGLKNFVAKLAGKFLGSKLKLTEGKMEDGKKWYQSKTILSGIVIAVIGAYDLVRLNIAPGFGWNLPELPGWILSVLGGIGIYGRVTADKQIK